MHTLGRRYCNKSCWRRTRRLLERRKCPALSARELLSRVYQYQSTRHGSTMDACTQSAHIPSYAPHILWCVWTCGVKLTSIALTSPLPTAIHRSYRPDHRGEHLPPHMQSLHVHVGRATGGWVQNQDFLLVGRRFSYQARRFSYLPQCVSKPGTVATFT